MAVELGFYRFSVQGMNTRSPIAILHGVFGSKNNWRSVGKRLAQETGRPVYSMDARNHGDSPHTLKMSYELMSDDAARLLKAQRVDRSVIVGHSMGGKTAMALSLRYPQMIERLVVVDVAPVSSSGMSDILKQIRIMKSLDLNSIRNRREADEFLKDQISDPTIRGFLLSGLGVDRQSGVLRWKTNLEAVERNLSLITGFPQFSVQFKGPTLFVGGSKSPYIRPEVVPAIKKLFPNASVSHVDGAGHWPHFDKPNQFIKLLKDFVSDGGTSS